MAESLPSDHNGTPCSLTSAVRLPCGVTINNRFVKVAMYEHGAAIFGGPPNTYHQDLYRRWSDGRWGMIITGNVQVSPDHLTLGRDMVIPDTLEESTVQPFKDLSCAIRSCCSQTLAIMQLSHAGRQSPNVLGGRKPFASPLAPSAIRLGNDLTHDTSFVGRVLYRVLFQTPKEMQLDDIDLTVRQFTRGAQLAVEAGFNGIELHASHGYLLAQFISPKSNHRSDAYSTGDHALALVHRILVSIRDALPLDFIIGIKLNAADYTGVTFANQCDRSTAADVPLRHCREIAAWGLVDFIEISGGDYENPEFMGTFQPSSDRQALFSDFSRKAIAALTALRHDGPKATPLILLTGGLRTAAQCTSVLENGHAHLLGIGRSSVVYPDFPRRCERMWHTVNRLVGFPKLIGAGMEMAWYIVMMRRIAEGQEVDTNVGGVSAVMKMWLWGAPSRRSGHEKTALPWRSILVVLLTAAILFVRRIVE
ncbi:FMN-linked oxidoreductase [Gloeophyllum trabeum ATCC 11539]|uniref:FMN-linked oxidoreductase n=1 Tax=Gloeophyllum trabeum (strain ATCC 11539 / FP-39264 / Madison 617) TaxID=670483 RepID=S7PXD5_GLOTA|nr:FMN-linked oxidoreductase [Gloeophyllum trabeum ATCC 11539]EPQ52266.1 FMN-linked oxidoreductase [Gloeophyllum trabeum ATCC 11539]